LQLASILPGQTADKRFSIPSRKSTYDTNEARAEPAPKEDPQPSSEPKEQPAPVKKEENLPPVDETFLATGDLSKLTISDEEKRRAGKLIRLDSQTNEMDEFSDARS
jgi:hypothetical protein